MTAEQQLRSFIAKFGAAHQRLIRGPRAALRKQLPGANELVYDNYNFFVIAYSPTEKPTDSYFSLGANAHGANQFFGNNGTQLEDPAHLLLGKGSKNRFLRLDSVATLALPDVRTPIASALAISKPMASTKGKLIIKGQADHQRAS